MPTADTIKRFIARVEENAHAQAIEEFYAPQASTRENHETARVGRDGLVAHERQVLARARTVRSRCVLPVFTAGDHVVLRWVFDFEWLDGSHTHMEELAVQRWEGEHIGEEQFFYDPVQRRPSASPHSEPPTAG